MWIREFISDSKEWWDKWDIRVLILLSLLLQILLIFFAPLRKRVSRGYISFPMWLAYLLAEAIADYAVGLISKSRSQDTPGASSPSSPPPTRSQDTPGASGPPLTDPKLLALWAPFLLVHLGGPDTITAFALEDNQLWLRHLLQLVFQSLTAGYIIVVSLWENRLWIPTLLMFVSGFIKYTERTVSLFLASSRRFRESLLKEPDAGPNYAKLMDEYFSKKEAKLPSRIEMIPEPKRVSRATDESKSNPEDLTDLQVVQHAHRWYKTFKGLIADLIFSFRERDQSRTFFLNRSPRDAFQVVQVELNFIYEILYTKAKVVKSRLGIIFRFLSMSLNIVALVLFHLADKKGFHGFDVGITYTLLYGAIALDIIASLMVLFSDWTAVFLTESDYPNLFVKFLRIALNVNRERWPKNPEEHCTLSFGWWMQLVRCRWSESISQHNLIYYCLHPRSTTWETTVGIFGLTSVLDSITYVETIKFPDDLRDFIFNELKLKAEMADDLETAKEIYEAKGDWVLRYEGCTELLKWIDEVDFDESLLLWHVATEICLYTNTSHENANSSESAQKKKFRKYSELLSNYMLYLLMMQPTMMSPVAGIGQIRFRDTCAEVKKFFRGRKIEVEEQHCCWNYCCYCCGIGKCFQGKKKDANDPAHADHPQTEGQSCMNCCCCFKKCSSEEKKGSAKSVQDAETELHLPGRDEAHKKACKSIHDVNTAVSPVAVKGDRSKSVLFEGCILAKKLNELGEGRRWKIMSKVWVEMLTYAACRCRANSHAAQLSKGGQLITLVWLLAAHLGLGNQFQISAGHARAKLIVGK